MSQSNSAASTPHQKIKTMSPTTLSPMVKNVDTATSEYRRLTSNTTIELKMTMMPFAAPLYLDEKEHIIMANGYCNHNYQNWSGYTALEITNNMCGNPLKRESTHMPTAGDQMKLLLINYKKVSETKSKLFPLCTID